MVIRINGEDYYRSAEACQIAGTNKNTFLRWVRKGSFPDVKNRDRRGWRIFTKADIARLKAEVNSISTIEL
jgi:predicted site-specific integrase-resolvase